MALAAFDLIKTTGTAPGTENDSQHHPCYLSVDSNSTDTDSNSIAVPKSGGPNFSYEQALRFKCTVAPDNYCENFEVWGPPVQPDHDRNPANKVTIYWGVSASYSQPTNSQSSIATTRQDTNYYDSEHALLLHSEQITAINQKTNLLYDQMQVALGAQQGKLTTMTRNLAYDEV